MQNTFTNRTATWFALIGTIILIGLSSWVFTISARMPESQPWVLMALVDILVVVPLIWYMVVLRPRGMRPLALMPLFVVSCGVAWLLLPSAYQSWLAPIWIVLPLLELVMMGVLIVRLRRIVVWYRAHRHEHPYFVDALIDSVSSELGSSLAVRLFVLETLMIYLSFVGWFLRYRQVQPQHQLFFYHQKSRYTPVFMAWMSVMLIETVLFHLLIQGWNETVAWVITGISIYSCFWLAGEYTLIKLSPHVLDGTTLYLRAGLRWSTQITLDHIAAVEKPKRADAKSPDYVAFVRSDEPQLVLILAHPVRVDGLFGSHKTVSRIGVFVDDLARFQQMLGIEQTERRYLV